MFLTLYFHFDFLMSLFFWSEYIPGSAFNTVLLVVLGHLSISLAAVICTVTKSFTIFALPSHTSVAYSSFGTINFRFIWIRIDPGVKVRVC